MEQEKEKQEQMIPERDVSQGKPAKPGSRFRAQSRIDSGLRQATNTAKKGKDVPTKPGPAKQAAKVAFGWDANI